MKKKELICPLYSIHVKLTHLQDSYYLIDNSIILHINDIVKIYSSIYLIESDVKNFIEEIKPMILTKKLGLNFYIHYIEKQIVICQRNEMHTQIRNLIRSIKSILFSYENSKYSYRIVKDILNKCTDEIILI